MKHVKIWRQEIRYQPDRYVNKALNVQVTARG